VVPDGGVERITGPTAVRDVDTPTRIERKLDPGQPPFPFPVGQDPDHAEGRIQRHLDGLTRLH
jgi:hypothetical protein